jgi:enoyl-CoA hydratase/carnithine racemase
VTQPLLIEHDDGVDQVTLNRPENLNQDVRSFWKSESRSIADDSN